MVRTGSLVLALALLGACPPPAPRRATDGFSDDVAFEDEGSARYPASDHVQAGEAALAAGELAEASAAFRAALAENPDDPRALLDLGLVLELQDEYPDAEAAYRRALALDPEFPEALNNLGLLLRDTERSAEARPVLERAVAARPGFGEAWLNLAMTREDLGDATAAEEAYHRAIELSSEDALARTNFGFFLLAQERRDAAALELRRALSLARGDALTLVEIARGLRRARQPEPALQALARAMELLGEPSAALLSERSLNERALGRDADAEASLRAALALDASYLPARYLLGTLLLEGGQGPEGRALLEEVVRSAAEPLRSRARQALGARR